MLYLLFLTPPPPVPPPSLSPIPPLPPLAVFASDSLSARRRVITSDAFIALSSDNPELMKEVLLAASTNMTFAFR